MSDFPDLANVMRRAGIKGAVANARRLSGGANLESWLFECGGEAFVLRRAPSAEWLESRSFDMTQEAQLVRHAAAGGVPAPEVVAELLPEDGIGCGFVMRCLPGTAEPESVLAGPESLAGEIAAAIAQIHALDPKAVPFLPSLEPAAGVEDLFQRFVEAGGDRPIIALGIAWLRANLPPAVPPRVVHGDLRIGNLMCDAGHLTGVLDWELAHLGDGHEDLAFGCMAVWRFGRLDKPGFGLTDLGTLATAYEAAGGERFDPVRFRFWLVYRTIWWALGCLQMGLAWRNHLDRSLERVVIARRTAEQELDLLMLLDHLAPPAERARALPASRPVAGAPAGEPSGAEILTAVSEWLASDIKPLATGRTRFDLAVARNALAIVAREIERQPVAADRELADALLDGTASLATAGLLARLRRLALDKVAADMPKYPALAQARAQWEGR